MDFYIYFSTFHKLSMIPQLLFISLLFAPGGYISYTNPEKDYSFEINERASYLRKASYEDGTYIDMFNIISAENSKIAEYVLTVMKVSGDQPFSMEGLLSNTFKNSYLSTCSCEVTSSSRVKYKSLTGVLFNTRIKKSNGYIGGYAFTVAKGKNLYSVTFLTPEVSVSKFKDEIEHTLNSMEVFK
jgi:hypothetical protein